MLSFFPQILFLAPYSSTILRLTSGLFFVYIGYQMCIRRAEFTRVEVPIIGTLSVWMIWFSAIATILDGLALIAGFGTQLAAIIGMIIAIKHFALSQKYEMIRPVARTTYVVLFIICICLLLSGAGPYAIDYPL